MSITYPVQPLSLTLTFQGYLFHMQTALVLVEIRYLKILLFKVIAKVKIFEK